jgi:hypothetical protein
MIQMRLLPLSPREQNQHKGIIVPGKKIAISLSTQGIHKFAFNLSMAPTYPRVRELVAKLFVTYLKKRTCDMVARLKL